VAGQGDAPVRAHHYVGLPDLSAFAEGTGDVRQAQRLVQRERRVDLPGHTRVAVPDSVMVRSLVVLTTWPSGKIPGSR
jgi:hypothetical protein